MPASKPLIRFNGPGIDCRKVSDERWRETTVSKSEVRAFVAAHSRADARRVIEEYCGIGNGPSDSQMKQHWSAGHWGVTMEGITPERGLWIVFRRGDSPVRVV